MRLLFIFLALLSAPQAFAVHALQEVSRDRAADNEPVFNPKLIKEFTISGNLVGKTQFPDDMPDFEHYSFGSKDETKVDLAQLKNDDPRWTNEIRRFWRNNVQILEREIEAVRALFPELKNQPPMEFLVRGVSDIGSDEHYINVIVPSDFKEPEVLRRKLITAALYQSVNARQGKRPSEVLAEKHKYRIPEMKSAEYPFYLGINAAVHDLFSRAYALANSSDWQASRYAVAPGLHNLPQNVGKYTSAERQALKLRPRSEQTFLNMRQEARNGALKDHFFGEDFNERSALGLAQVAMSFLAEAATEIRDPKLLQKWWKFLHEHRDDPRMMKVFIPKESGSAEPSLSLAKLLSGFGKTLPLESQEAYRALLLEYGLSFKDLDDLHRDEQNRGREGEWDDVVENDGFPKLRSHVDKREWTKRPHATSMPDINGWKVAPEETGQIPNKKHTYRVNRVLKDYFMDLPGVPEALSKLTKDSHWIDAGSGEAAALEDYLTRTKGIPENELSVWGGDPEGRQAVQAAAIGVIASKPLSRRARTTGVTLKSMRQVPNFDGRLRNLEGKFFEDYSDEELGKADLITDEIGVLSYTNQPEITLNKYLRLLKPDGLVSVNLSSGYTIVQMKNGEQMPFPDWLQKQPGLIIDFPDSSNHNRFSVRKADGASPVLPKLKFVFSDTHSPPRRVYLEE